jgi:protein phosphatase methylesterase 1
VWRTDLLASEPYWREWFLGLSDLFLQCHAMKLLVLAGPDRLDKPLTVAHMQVQAFFSTFSSLSFSS